MVLGRRVSVWTLVGWAWAIIATILILYPLIPLLSCPYKWNGGSPHFQGSCWCGWDGYCMCTPSLAIDAIIEVQPSSPSEDIRILLVHRRDPPRDLFAIPGGFVDIGETVEAATIREVREETNLVISSLEQFRVYSDPLRDKRRHTVRMISFHFLIPFSRLALRFFLQNFLHLSLR